MRTKLISGIFVSQSLSTAVVFPKWQKADGHFKVVSVRWEFWRGERSYFAFFFLCNALTLLEMMFLSVTTLSLSMERVPVFFLFYSLSLFN